MPMSKYDVYGIGNALVDIVTEVTDEFLTKHQVVEDQPPIAS